MRRWNLKDATRSEATSIPRTPHQHKADHHDRTALDYPSEQERAPMKEPHSESFWLVQSPHLVSQSDLSIWTSRPLWTLSEGGEGICHDTVDPMNGCQDTPVSDGAINDTTIRMENLEMSSPLVEARCDPSTGPIAACQDTDRLERAYLWSPKGSRSSSMSIDSTRRPTHALALSDHTSWGFAEVTGLPDRPPRSDSTFGTSITKAAEGKPPLDARFYPRTPARKFFKIGRLFAISRSSGADSMGSAWSSDPWATDLRAPGIQYLRTCKLVVVQEGSCSSLCVPVTTYGGRGISRKHFNQDEANFHAIIFLKKSGADPQYLSGEAKSIKRPIAVKPASEDLNLHPASRLNFGKVHQVPHEASVMNIGKVEDQGLPYLSQYFRTHAKRV